MDKRERVKDTLISFGWHEFTANKLADEICTNLDNYAKIQEVQANRMKTIMQVYDNHTKYGAIQAQRMVVRNA